MIRRAFLNGQGDNVPGLLFALFLGAGFNIPHHGSGIVEGFLLDALHQLLAGLILGHAGDALQLGELPRMECLGFFLDLLNLGLLFVQAFFPGLHIIGLFVQGFLTLVHAALGALHFVAALPHFPVVLGLGFEDLFLGLQHFFLFVFICLAGGVFQQLLGIGLGAADFLLGHVPAVDEACCAAGAQRHKDQQNPYNG